MTTRPIRKCRKLVKSPYFEKPLDDNLMGNVDHPKRANESNSEDDFVTPVKFTPKISTKKTRIKRKELKPRNPVCRTMQPSPSSCPCGNMRTSTKSIKYAVSGSDSSDDGGWEDIESSALNLESKSINAASEGELEFMSQLLQKNEADHLPDEGSENGDIVISVSTVANPKSTRDPETLARLALSKQQRETRYAFHVFSTLGFLTFGRYANRTSDSPSVRAFGLSLIKCPDIDWRIGHLQTVALAFTRLVKRDVVNRNPDLCKAIHTRLELGRLSHDDCVLLMTSGLRACGLDARLILAFAPPSLKPDNAKKSVHSVRTLKPLSNSTNSRNKIVSSSDSEADEPYPHPQYCLFSEVYLPHLKGWVTVDLSPPVGRATMDPVQLPGFYYVLGFTSTLESYLDRSPVDLAARYDPTWMLPSSRANRLPTPLWNKLLETMQTHCTRDVVKLREKTLRFREDCEEQRDAMDVESIFDRLRAQPLPKRVQDFKGHPLFALKRHLLKFEVIHPSDAPAIGFLKVSKVGEEPIFPRECVHVCHTRESWLKEAKTVRVGEKPAKLVTAMMSMKRKLLQESTDGPPPTVEVYGPWQVVDYVPPVAKDGRVPRNEHGNVELFKACMLPVGCTHIRLSGIQHIAKSLEMDVAPAMVGWSFHKAGWAHPEFDGFVVCSENVPPLMDAWRAARMDAAKAAALERTERVLANWRRFTHHLLLWQRVEARFKMTRAAMQQQDSAKSNKKSSIDPKKASHHHPLVSDVDGGSGKGCVGNSGGGGWQPLATAVPVFPPPLKLGNDDPRKRRPKRPSKGGGRSSRAKTTKMRRRKRKDTTSSSSPSSSSSSSSTTQSDAWDSAAGD